MLGGASPSPVPVAAPMEYQRRRRTSTRPPGMNTIRNRPYRPGSPKITVHCVPTPRNLRRSTDGWDKTRASRSVTVIVGTKDRLVPQGSRQIRRLAVRRTHDPYDQSGPVPILEAPEQFADALDTAPRTHTLE